MEVATEMNHSMTTLILKVFTKDFDHIAQMYAVNYPLPSWNPCYIFMVHKNPTFCEYGIWSVNCEEMVSLTFATLNSLLNPAIDNIQSICMYYTGWINCHCACLSALWSLCASWINCCGISNVQVEAVKDE